MSHIIVLGAGQAGASTAAKLRSLGYDGSLTLIGQEPLLPYQRPPLSKKYLLGEASQERLFIRPESFYQEQNIRLMRGATATSIDKERQEIEVDGQKLGYDHLVLTLGAAPRRLPAAIGGALQGVFEMRNMADADAMAQAFRPGAKVLIVGGGYIGLEAAAVARQRDLEVVLVEKADRILQRVACSQTSDYFRNLHQQNGVDLREGVGLSHLLEASGHVCGAMLEDGRQVTCDFVIVGVGIMPVTEIAASAGLEIDNGIAVNAFSHSSCPTIWAAGDCASFPYKDGRLRLESVQNAIDQAENVAQNIMGAQVPYHPYPWFWSDQYDTKLQIAGLNSGYERIITRHTEAGQSHWYFASDTLLSVDAMNDPRAYMIGKRLIEMGKSPDPAMIADPGVDLKPLLRG